MNSCRSTDCRLMRQPQDHLVQHLPGQLPAVEPSSMTQQCVADCSPAKPSTGAGKTTDASPRPSCREAIQRGRCGNRSKADRRPGRHSVPKPRRRLLGRTNVEWSNRQRPPEQQHRALVARLEIAALRLPGVVQQVRLASFPADGNGPPRRHFGQRGAKPLIGQGPTTGRRNIHQAHADPTDSSVPAIGRLLA